MDIYKKKPEWNTFEVDDDFVQHLEEHGAVVYEYLKEIIEDTFDENPNGFSVVMPDVNNVCILLVNGDPDNTSVYGNYAFPQIILNDYPEFTNKASGRKMHYIEDFKTPAMQKCYRRFEIRCKHYFKQYSLGFGGIKIQPGMFYDKLN